MTANPARHDFRRHPARVQALEALVHPFRTWDAPDGSRWLEFFRTSQGYLLRFPGYGDFELSLDGHRIQGWPAPEASASMFEHLYLNQVVPLALSQQGNLVLHASAVEIGTGAVAFAAPTGRGKSTLAASFALAGHRFLSDDALPLDWRGGQLAAMPGHPSIRLLDDSREAILGSAEGPSGPADHRGKLRFLSGPQIRHVDDPMPLRAIYYIGEGLAPAPVIEPMPPAEAAMALVRHSFLLDVDTAELLATHFGDVSEIGTLPIHFRLDYPRHFEGLAPVRDAIGTHLRDVGLE